MGHTGGDLSLPEEVRRRVMPSAFPVFDALPKQPDASRFDALPQPAAQAGPDGVRPSPTPTEGVTRRGARSFPRSEAAATAGGVD